MKTMEFSRILLDITSTGDITLEVYTPEHGKPLMLELTPDELMVFLVECTNKLEDARDLVVLNRAARDLLREQRKVKHDMVTS